MDGRAARVGGSSRGRGGNAREVRMKKDAAAAAAAVEAVAAAEGWTEGGRNA